MRFDKRTTVTNIILLFAILLGTVLLLAACAKEEPSVVSSPTPFPPVVLRMNWGEEPPTADPALAVDQASIDLVGSLFVGLTQIDEETSDVIPGLAASWDTSPDGTVYTFHLRDEFRWTDGKPVTAYDAEYGILRTLNPDTASEYAYVLTAIIKGAADYNSGTSTDPSLVGVKALDDYTLAIEILHPAGYFPAIASMWVMYPQPQWAIDAHGDEWTEPGNIVTNGPYMLESWEHEQGLTLAKNPDYYRAYDVQIDRIEAVIVREASTEMVMYEAGDLDCVCGWGVPLEDIDRVKADPTLSQELFIAPQLATYYYGFNNAKAPFDNPLVRKAFSAAIDRQGLIDNVLKGGQKEALTFTAPGNFGAIVDARAQGIGHPFFPAKARQYLEEAGYPGGQGFPEITLVYNTSEGHKKIAEAIQAMWAEHLGVTVTVVNQDWGVYLNTVQTDAPHIFRMGWSADYPDANNWLNEVFHSTSGSNYSRYNNPQYDELVEQAAREQDAAIRLDLYRQAEVLLSQEDAAIAPIYHYTWVRLNKPYLLRTYAPFGPQQFKNWQQLSNIRIHGTGYPTGGEGG